MLKPFASSFFAIVIFFIAGYMTESYSFGVNIVALFSVGFVAIGYSFISHARWCDNKNYSDRVIYELLPNRAYMVIDRGTVGSDSVSFLYDTVAKKSIVYRGPHVPRGFFEVKKGEKTYLVASGKLLVEGKVGDCVFAPTQ